MELHTAFHDMPSPTLVISADGALGHLAGEVRRAGEWRALAACSGSVVLSGLLAQVQEALGEVDAGACSGAAEESPLTQVLARVEAARAAGAGCLMGVDGGSAAVTTRAIALLLAEQGDVAELATQ